MNILETGKKKMAVLLQVFTAITVICGSHSNAQTPPDLVFTPVITSGLSTKSLDIVSAADGSNRLFIVGLEGTVRMWTGTGTSTSIFMDISGDSIPTPQPGSERGLLSLAFHPDYNGTTNRYFFIWYCINTVPQNIPCIRLTRFETMIGDPNLADESTGTVLLTIEQPEGDHCGGK
ncbi:MAG: hypothetical protein WBO39_02485, partial [Ferruginibacter sp.]